MQIARSLKEQSYGQMPPLPILNGDSDIHRGGRATMRTQYTL